VTLTFDNAQDWDITSNISGTFSYAPMTPTPEPASIVLFLSGLAGLPIIRSRMNRKQAAATVAA
ncbi:MAG TPA: PEP-CTERM sorting domain-containing protein, partial [Stellaceae bacterium]|nr:PEP-CTERM sorting domain-containing protein [Stellaceae bacterium]